ncbi:MAG TPA: D-2-hydroxyacid dehydrogenase [Bacteroidales bacterium]|nr:D-2-hydroxyacid dehydrogenase [Bacteroidales bacterium]
MFRPGIVLLDADTLGDISIFPLTKLGNLTVYQTTPSDQRIERISGKEIIITNKVEIDRNVMDASPDLRLICVAATGMNNVDLEYAKQKGIRVMNVAGYSTESVVQHTFSMLFHIMTDLGYYNQYVQNGDYAESGLFTHHGKPFYELAGKNYGIIGMGTIGKRIAEVAGAFRANVSYYSTSGKNLDTGYRHVPLHELLMESDIVSVHCPLNDTTRDLIGYEELCVMKKSAILINAGRGGIVNESDLACALDEELIGYAALDVMSREPADASNPLFHLKNPEKLLITPHIAWASIESRERLMEGITNNISSFLKEVSK